MPTVRDSSLIPMYLKPPECSGCSLHELGTGFSIPEGSGLNGVLLLGESLGYHEAKDGLPFRPYADAGSVLERAIRMCGFTRAQFVLFNVVACKPPDNELAGTPFEITAINHCKVHLNEVIRTFQPRVILCLGAVPFRAMTGMDGERQSLSELRGYCVPAIDWNDRCTVIGTYHPSYIARGAWESFPVLIRDLKFAVSVAKNGPPSTNVAYNLEPGARDLEEMRDYLLATPEDPLSLDFESQNDVDPPEDRRPENEIITQVNLSVAPSTGLALVNWRPYEDLIKELLATPNRKVGHNLWGFDYLVGYYNGLQIDGEIDDGMLKFHHIFPDLPGRTGKRAKDDEDGGYAPLQFVSSFFGFPFPWKYMNAERPEFYGCADADAALRNDIALNEELRRNGLETGYQQLVKDIAPILISMSARGIPINLDSLNEFDKTLTTFLANIDRKIQEIVPKELCLTRPSQGFVRTPKDTTGMVLKPFLIEGGNKRCKCFKIRRKNLSRYLESEWTVIDDKGRVKAPEPDCEVCKGRGGYFQPSRTVERWCKVLPFNAASPVQMKEYAASRGHKIPKNSQKKISMDIETMERLYKKTKDPLYLLKIEDSKASKLKDTYVKGWQPDSYTKRVHSQFGFGPATGQLNSSRPNVQTMPNEGKQKALAFKLGAEFGDLAGGFRSCVEAPEGYTLIECDFKSFHAQTLGVEAKDAAYIRLAKLDIHSYLAAHLLKLPDANKALTWCDDELRVWLKWIKKNYEGVRNGKAKPGILGYGFGLGAAKLYSLNDESFKNVGEAQWVIDMLNRTFPKTAEFRSNIPAVADRQKFLKSAYGAIRWFWDVRKFDPRRKEFTHGGDWERAIAFLPANDAFGMMKRSMCRLEQSGFNDLFGLINQVHDSLLFCCESSKVEEAVNSIKPIMELPSEVLFMPDGSPFNVEVEVKVGKNWGKMEEVKV